MAGLLSPDPVAETLRRWASEPFRWGNADCALSVLAHVERVTGRSWDDRPRYVGEIGAAGVLKRHGGFGKIAARAMAALGCPATEAPVRGDVGLVDLAATGLTACLCVGPDRWAARGHHEVIVVSARAELAWHVPGGALCPRQ